MHSYSLFHYNFSIRPCNSGGFDLGILQYSKSIGIRHFHKKCHKTESGSISKTGIIYSHTEWLSYNLNLKWTEVDKSKTRYKSSKETLILLNLNEMHQQQHSPITVLLSNGYNHQSQSYYLKNTISR